MSNSNNIHFIEAVINAVKFRKWIYDKSDLNYNNLIKRKTSFALIAEYFVKSKKFENISGKIYNY